METIKAIKPRDELELTITEDQNTNILIVDDRPENLFSLESS